MTEEKDERNDCVVDQTDWEGNPNLCLLCG
jgi:hypothetical protein